MQVCLEVTENSGSLRTNVTLIFTDIPRNIYPHLDMLINEKGLWKIDSAWFNGTKVEFFLYYDTDKQEISITCNFDEGTGRYYRLSVTALEGMLNNLIFYTRDHMYSIIEEEQRLIQRLEVYKE